MRKISIDYIKPYTLHKASVLYLVISPILNTTIFPIVTFIVIHQLDSFRTLVSYCHFYNLAKHFFSFLKILMLLYPVVNFFFTEFLISSSLGLLLIVLSDVINNFVSLSKLLQWHPCLKKMLSLFTVMEVNWIYCDHFTTVYMNIKSLHGTPETNVICQLYLN